MFLKTSVIKIQHSWYYNIDTYCIAIDRFFFFFQFSDGDRDVLTAHRCFDYSFKLWRISMCIHVCSTVETVSHVSQLGYHSGSTMWDRFTGTTLTCLLTVTIYLRLCKCKFSKNTSGEMKFHFAFKRLRVPHFLESDDI